jgi:hypothetical protein
MVAKYSGRRQLSLVLGASTAMWAFLLGAVAMIASVVASA